MQLLECSSKLQASQAECSGYRQEMQPLKVKVEQCYRDLTTLRCAQELLLTTGFCCVVTVMSVCITGLCNVE